MTPAARVWRAILTLALILVVTFAVVAPPERCPSVTAVELRRSAESAVAWFVRNQEPDGSWLYEYDAGEDSIAPEYNEVRHAGVTMGLYQAAAAGLPGASGSADRGTDWALDKLYERDGWAALAAPDRVTTGATALLVAGLVIRRQATADMHHDDVLRSMGRFLVTQTQPSGAVLAEYDRAREAPVRDRHSKYYTGEAYWALALLHRAFPGEEWDAAADRIGAYLATSRDDVEGYWPPIPDHWAAYGMSETIGFPERGRPPLSEDELAYARRQAQLFGVQARWLSQQHGPWGGLVRGTELARGGWYGVVGEGLTGWWLTAQADPRLAGMQGAVARRAICVAALAVAEQSGPDDAASAARPERVQGAWYRDGETRMDDQQHALAGLLRSIQIVEANSPASGDEGGPSGWLWVAVLVLALNPARAAFAAPRSRSPRTAAGMAAAGGILGGLAVCVAAAVGAPLLDALDVSQPSFRVAAGVVAVVTGVADLLRQPPPPEPALAGRRAVLIPIAIPVVARPALLVLALGAGAGSSILVSVGAMVLGTALLTVLAARCPTDGPGGRVLRWAGRVLGAALISCGVILVLDGVLDV